MAESPNNEIFVCTCGVKLRNVDDVEEHNMSWFQRGHRKQCPFPGCDRIFPQTYNAKRHWRTHLPANLSRHFCSRCGTSYAKQEHLDKHKANPTCFYNRKKCRSTFEEDDGAAPSIQPAATRQKERVSVPNGEEVDWKLLYSKTSWTSVDQPLPLIPAADPLVAKGHPSRLSPFSTPNWTNFTSASLVSKSPPAPLDSCLTPHVPPAVEDVEDILSESRVPWVALQELRNIVCFYSVYSSKPWSFTVYACGSWDSHASFVDDCKTKKRLALSLTILHKRLWEKFVDDMAETRLEFLNSVLSQHRHMVIWSVCLLPESNDRTSGRWKLDVHSIRSVAVGVDDSITVYPV